MILKMPVPPGEKIKIYLLPELDKKIKDSTLLHRYTYLIPAKIADRAYALFLNSYNVHPDSLRTYGEKAYYLKKAVDLLLKNEITDIDLKLILAGLLRTIYDRDRYHTWSKFYNKLATLRYVGLKRLHVLKQHSNLDFYNEDGDNFETPGM